MRESGTEARVGKKKKNGFPTRALDFRVSTNVSRPTGSPLPRQETPRGPVELSSFFCNNAKEEAPSPHHPPISLQGKCGEGGGFPGRLIQCPDLTHTPPPPPTKKPRAQKNKSLNKLKIDESFRRAAALGVAPAPPSSQIGQNS